MKNNIMLFAGEKSGEKHASCLIPYLTKINPNVKLCGIGSGAMNTPGFKSLGTITHLNAFQYGFLSKIFLRPKLNKVISKVKTEIKKNKPDAFVFIGIADDTQYFVKQLLKIANKNGIKTYYYFSPHVWLYSNAKTKKVAREVDCIFTFFDKENALYRNAGANTVLIGHPVVNELPPKTQKQVFIKQNALPENKILVALLPGSRKNEIRLHTPVLLELCALFKNKENVFFVTPEDEIIMSAKIKQGFLKLSNHAFINSQNAYYKTISACDFSITSSGTACLETALYKTPQCVFYKLPRFDYFIWRIYAFFKRVKKLNIAMPNIITGKEIIPEFLQGRATPENLHSELIKIINAPDKQKCELDVLMKKLSNTNAIETAARFILNE